MNSVNRQIKEIYVSSIAFNGRSAGEVIECALNSGLPIEFTSSFGSNIGLEALYLNTPIKRMAHNYFPAPEIPFVLNLASGNRAIRDRSIQHCLNGLRLCKHSNSPFYAAHAGFCLDPSPTELGGKVGVPSTIDRDFHLAVFLESIETILRTARELDIHFLIENNVLIQSNFVHGQNPLLCCDSSELKWVVDRIKSNHFGLLLDTAHLKVSCTTLGLNMDKEVNTLKPYIRGVHHSDNNGLVDDNQSLKADYWFGKHLSDFENVVHVIEVKDIGLSGAIEQVTFLGQYGN